MNGAHAMMPGMAWRTALLCLALLSGCNLLGPSPCDKTKMSALAKQLGETATREHPAVVSKGLVGACGSSLPPTAKAYLERYDDENAFVRLGSPGEDKRYLDLAERVCPGVEEISREVATAPADQRALIRYDRCKLERFGLITREEAARDPTGWLLPWGLHKWFLDQGVDTEVASSITMALFVLDRSLFADIQPTRDQKLVSVAAGDPLETSSGVPIYLSPTDITFGDKKIVQIGEDGAVDPAAVKSHLIGPLYDALAEEVDKGKQMAEAQGEAWSGTLLIVSDARIVFNTLIEAMYTAGRAGFREYHFVVERDAWDYRIFNASPPSYPVGNVYPPEEEWTVLKVFIQSDRFDVFERAEDGSFAEPVRIPFQSGQPSFEAVTARAKAIKAELPGVRQAILSASAETTHEVLLRTMEAIRGPGCEPDHPDRCVLPDVIIEAGAE